MAARATTASRRVCEGVQPGARGSCSTFWGSAAFWAASPFRTWGRLAAEAWAAQPRELCMSTCPQAGQVPIRGEHLFAGRVGKLLWPCLPCLRPQVHQAVVASGARFSGPTIHFVDEEYDTGGWAPPACCAAGPLRALFLPQRAFIRVRAHAALVTRAPRRGGHASPLPRCCGTRSPRVPPPGPPMPGMPHPCRTRRRCCPHLSSTPAPNDLPLLRPSLAGCRAHPGTGGGAGVPDRSPRAAGGARAEGGAQALPALRGGAVRGAHHVAARRRAHPVERALRWHE